MTVSIEPGELFMLMDEATVNRLQNAYSIGWDNEWANAA